MSVNTLGRYRIIREIARSNDVVYEAVDSSISRRVALKELLLPPNLVGAQKQERVDRFYREARAAGSLTHPNIVTIYEAGDDHGRHFIAMEYLEGRTLRDVIETEGQLSVEKAVEIVKQVCDGLAYAHSKGVVHRDIKPDNIQILPNGSIKITDFGIARIMEEPTLTADGQVFGTPSYMSPEQIAGKNLDCRTDLFSLGVMLYEMLVGRKPFTGDSVVTITYNIMNQDVVIPPTVPPYLGRVISRSLSKDPNLRYDSATDMAAGLDPGNYQPDFLNTTTGMPGPIYGPPQTPPQLPPDPFANMKSDDLSLPKLPPMPIISSEARYFIGIMLAVVLACGMIIALIWGISVAYQRQEQMAKSQQIESYFEAGKNYFDQQSYQAALEKFNQILNMSNDPKVQARAKENIAVCYVALGDEAYKSGRTADASKWWEGAIQVDPSSPDALERMAILYLQRGNDAARNGDNSSAAQWWRKAMDTAPGTNAGQQAMNNLQRMGGN